MAVRIADLMSLVSDLVDFYKSAHEALAERRLRRAQAAASARAVDESPAPNTANVESADSAPTPVSPS